MSGTRCILDRNEDLELRLAPPLMSKGATPRDSLIRAYNPNVIMLDDDYEDDDDNDDDDDAADDEDSDATEEDMQTRNLLSLSHSRASELSEEDLELRLGLTAYSRYPLEPSGVTHISQRAGHVYAENKPNLLPRATQKPKMKLVGEEVKLRCTICMDSMREETSTTCGHVFCRLCITNAVIFQKKCPTCRMKLSLQHIHRIYLPASTS